MIAIRLGGQGGGVTTAVGEGGGVGKAVEVDVMRVKQIEDLSWSEVGDWCTQRVPNVYLR